MQTKAPKIQGGGTRIQCLNKEIMAAGRVSNNIHHRDTMLEKGGTWVPSRSAGNGQLP